MELNIKLSIIGTLTLLINEYIVPENHYFFLGIIEIVQKIVDFYLK